MMAEGCVSADPAVCSEAATSPLSWEVSHSGLLHGS